jgi:hypothetical protein
VRPTESRRQSGQVMILVAVVLMALIGSAALILLAGSVEWQKNQLQELADATALDAATTIGTGCDAAKANAIITEADNFLATRRTRTGALGVAAGTCATPYIGTDTFAGGLSASYRYPYRARQQQLEVVLTLTLPISFGATMGASNTTVIRRAVAQALAGSVPAISATTLGCTAGQVNVAGTFVSRNAITRAGTCAFYAHTRFDATSSTYSDLGNVSVYIDGQTWTAPGTCVAGSNSGSLSAICADGFELSGHTAPACGTASTSFLSAGDAVINPNPCAAGTARSPVPPFAVRLPPDPNTDAAAIGTLQGTGGAACVAGAVHPNIVVSGVTVATGPGPVPIKDASGFFHFKPSCYGYINVAAVPGSITNVQIGIKSAVTSPTVTPTLPVASTAGTLLVAVIRSGPSGTAFTAPAGWVRANSVNRGSASRSEIWYYPNNPGGISSAAFGVPNGAIAQMTEWRNALAVAPLDRTGTLSANTTATATLSTSAATTVANDLVITLFSPEIQSPQTYTAGAGWNPLVKDMPNGFASEYRLDLPAAVASETVTVTRATRWSGVIAAFKPGPGRAVLDPGFYYFNGSGFAGGGGICLNGGTLLARDVTLEFVNRAGFSSGTCAAGGGAACTAPCVFGSVPCSISVCPPNVGADAPNNLTWFAAPCSKSPTAADSASCPGSAWCPTGDRSCWHVLIWAPASNSGQYSIKGAVARTWLLGSTYWPGTCTHTANGSSTIAGTISCGTLSMSAAVGAGTAVGGDAGVGTALVEAVLIE